MSKLILKKGGIDRVIDQRFFEVVVGKSSAWFCYERYLVEDEEWTEWYIFSLVSPSEDIYKHDADWAIRDDLERKFRREDVDMYDLDAVYSAHDHFLSQFLIAQKYET